MPDDLPAVIPATESKEERELRLFRAFCDAIAERATIAEACKKLGISWRFIWELKAEHIELAAEYARARSYSGHSWADHGSTVAAGAKPENVQVAKLQVDDAHWRSERANRKEFGHHVDVTSDGEQIRPAVVILPPLDPVPVQPGSESVTIIERQVTVTGLSAGDKLARALAEFRAGGRVLGPGEAP